jgi:hypothetical protein
MHRQAPHLKECCFSRHGDQAAAYLKGSVTHEILFQEAFRAEISDV